MGQIIRSPLSSLSVSVCLSVCALMLSLDQFHLRYLRKIARVKWQDRTPNTDVLNICGIMGIEAFLLKAQLRWVGHIMRMPDSRK